jgi:hypothetical protein
VQSRLDRLELLLERAVAAQGTGSMSSGRTSAEEEVRGYVTPETSQAAHGGNMAVDDGDGVLLMNEGGSQFVSSLHFALLADEVSSLWQYGSDSSQSFWERSDRRFPGRHTGSVAYASNLRPQC